MFEKETQVLPIDPEKPQRAVLYEAARIIQTGGLVAFPTETVYGLGADALSESAVQAIFTAKLRPAHDPIIVHITQVEALGALTTRLPSVVPQLAQAFWPGPLTLILPKSERVPDVVTAGGATVAVRCPSHPVARGLIEMAGTPIGAPSANRFSHTSPTTAQHVWNDLNGRIDLILDGGSTPIGVESTVLDVTGDVPLLLRPGGVTVEMLHDVLDALVVDVAHTTAPSEIQRSPGLLERHYAPQTPLWLVSGSDTAIVKQIGQLLAQQPSRKEVGLLLAEEDAEQFQGHPGPIEIVGSLHNLEQIAQNLFYAMRHLDAQHPALILARDYAETGIGRALRDRLRRASVRHLEMDEEE